MSGSAVLVRAPAFGVRVFQPKGEEHYPLIIQTMDEGGFGYPWELLLLAVEKGNDGQLHWRSPSCPGWRGTDDWAGLRVTQDAGMGLYSITLDGQTWDWPKHGSHGLLLLAHVRGLHPDHRDQDADRPYSDEHLFAEIRRVLREGEKALERVCLPRPRARSGVKGTVGRTPGPAVAEGPLCFALASCQYPPDIFDRMPEGKNVSPGPADASLMALVDLLEHKTRSADEKPSLLVMCGDQVYLDATAGLFDPKVLSDRVRRPYELLFGLRGAQDVFRRGDLVVEMIPDDHEIVDGYAPDDAREHKEERFVGAALAGYRRYQRADQIGTGDRVWFDRVHRGFAFFYGDTRTQRGPRNVALLDTAQILDGEQWGGLEKWMLQQRAGGARQPIFLVTPSIVLPRRLLTAVEGKQALMSDVWDGYPASLHRLLAFVCHNQIHNLVMLSGDEHLSCHAVADVRDEAGRHVRVHSIHSSALYAPYPFANSRKELLVEAECFHFQHAFEDEQVRKFSCKVETTFAPPGDGFATIVARQEGDRWWIDLRYFSGAGEKTPQPDPIPLTPLTS